MTHAKFVVLTSSRTGSTWLIDLLNGHPGVEAHGELFLPEPRTQPALAGRADYPRFIEVHANPGRMRALRVVSYLNRLLRHSSTVGFKLMYTQLRAYPEILPYAVLRRMRIVHLTRANLIDVIVSEQLARLTGTSHSPVGNVTAVPMVRLDPESLVERIGRLRANAGRARRLVSLVNCPTLEVTYENLLNDRSEFSAILQFLGIRAPNTQMESSLAKRGTRTHRDAILNYDEVREVLSSTSYRDMLQ